LLCSDLQLFAAVLASVVEPAAAMEAVRRCPYPQSITRLQLPALKYTAAAGQPAAAACSQNTTNSNSHLHGGQQNTQLWCFSRPSRPGLQRRSAAVPLTTSVSCCAAFLVPSFPLPLPATSSCHCSGWMITPTCPHLCRCQSTFPLLHNQRQLSASSHWASPHSPPSALGRPSRSVAGNCS